MLIWKDRMETLSFMGGWRTMVIRRVKSYCDLNNKCRPCCTQAACVSPQISSATSPGRRAESSRGSRPIGPLPATSRRRRKNRKHTCPPGINGITVVSNWNLSSMHLRRRGKDPMPLPKKASPMRTLKEKRPCASNHHRRRACGYRRRRAWCLTNSA